MDGAGVAVVVAAYVIGTFPTAVLAGRRAGRDVLAEGSGNPGASNVTRLAGRRAGAAVFAIDAAKGAVATGLGWAVGGRPLALAAGAAAVAGHCLPVWRRFRGGKGVATACGAVAVLEPVVGMAVAMLWALTYKLTKRASVASLVAVAALPAGTAALGRPLWEVAGIAAIAAFVVGRHVDNLRRLARGEEPSLVEPGRS